MSDGFTIEIDGLDRVLRKLGRIERLQDELMEPMANSLAYVKRRMDVAPRKAAGAFTALATPGQRRAYWYRVSQEKGMHGANGYIRGSVGGGAAEKAWTTETRRTGNGLIGVVGNNKSYAKYLYSRADQQPFHTASGWPTIEDVTDKSSTYIGRQFASKIRQILNT